MHACRYLNICAVSIYQKYSRIRRNNQNAGRAYACMGTFVKYVTAGGRGRFIAIQIHTGQLAPHAKARV